jgi:hypothetical protein
MCRNSEIWSTLCCVPAVFGIALKIDGDEMVSDERKTGMENADVCASQALTRRKPIIDFFQVNKSTALYKYVNHHGVGRTS